MISRSETKAKKKTKTVKINTDLWRTTIFSELLRKSLKFKYCPYCAQGLSDNSCSEHGSFTEQQLEGIVQSGSISDEVELALRQWLQDEAKKRSKT